jgi:hypothetical protein
MHSEDNEGGASTASTPRTNGRQQKTPIGNLMAIGSLSEPAAHVIKDAVRRNHVSGAGLAVVGFIEGRIALKDGLPGSPCGWARFTHLPGNDGGYKHGDDATPLSSNGCRARRADNGGHSSAISFHASRRPSGPDGTMARPKPRIPDKHEKAG